MEIQRYNQGFGGFGPLEKCSTGKLCKFEEASAAHELVIGELHDKHSRVQAYYCAQLSLKCNENATLTEQYMEANVARFVWRLVTVISWLLLIALVMPVKPWN